jgi:hypothetical protein
MPCRSCSVSVLSLTLRQGEPGPLLPLLLMAGAVLPGSKLWQRCFFWSACALVAFGGITCAVATCCCSCNSRIANNGDRYQPSLSVLRPERQLVSALCAHHQHSVACPWWSVAATSAPVIKGTVLDAALWSLQRRGPGLAYRAVRQGKCEVLLAWQRGAVVQSK